MNSQVVHQDLTIIRGRIVWTTKKPNRVLVSIIMVADTLLGQLNDAVEYKHQNIIDILNTGIIQHIKMFPFIIVIPIMNL